MTLMEGRLRRAGSFAGPNDITIDSGQSLRAILTHGKYKDAIEEDRLFRASVQAAQAVSVALATTYTGLCLSNPIGNTKRLSIRAVQIALSVAPANIASLHLIGGPAGVAPTDVTHTAAVTPRSCRLGSSATPTAKADSQATIPTPEYLFPLGSGFTAGALYATTPSIIDL